MAKKNYMTKKEKRELAVKQEQEVAFNTKTANHLVRISQIAKPKLSDPKDVDRACVMYFNACAEDDVRTTVSGLAMVLGVNRLTLIGMVNGTTRVENRDVLAKWFQMLEITDEIAMKEGKTNPVSAIFLAKNNYGYVDEQKVKVIDDELTDEEIEKRYRERHEVVSDQ